MVNPIAWSAKIKSCLWVIYVRVLSLVRHSSHMMRIFICMYKQITDIPMRVEWFGANCPNIISASVHYDIKSLIEMFRILAINFI